MDRGGFTIGRLLLLSYIKDYDAVPVVDVVGLYIRAFGLDGETVGIDTVFIYESIVDGLCATLGETHVVIACAGVLICVTDDGDILFGIGLHPFGDIVYIYHFGIGIFEELSEKRTVAIRGAASTTVVSASTTSGHGS